MRITLPLYFDRILSRISLPLLTLLCVFTIDKVLFKLIGISMVFLLNPQFSFRSKERGLPLFYLFIVIMELLKFFVLNKDFSSAHTASVGVGILFWILSFLALYQAKSIIDKTDQIKVDRTIEIFFLANVLVSLFQLTMAMVQSGSLNPFTSPDLNFGTSTGDRIRGIFLGPSYLNMMICSFFIFYFTLRHQLIFGFLALFTALLTTSNFANLVLLPLLIVPVFLMKEKIKKIAFAGYLATLILFYLFATPGNLRYLKSSIWVVEKQQKEIVAYQKQVSQQADHTTDKKNQPESVLVATSQSVPIPSTVEYAAARVDKLLRESEQPRGQASFISLKNQYGKVISFRQTREYLFSGTKPFLFGAGIGSYSSFLALRMSKLNASEGSGFFQRLPAYTAPEFRKHHCQIFQTVYSLPKVFHSVKHFPSSFVNQLFGEYGLTGALLFFFTYVWFFIRRFRSLSYGRYLLALLGCFLVFDYLFEYLSVVVVFELLMLKDLHENKFIIKKDGHE